MVGKLEEFRPRETKEQMVIVGKGHRRLDGYEAVTGQRLHLGTEMKLPGMLYAKLLGSIHAHAEVVSIDTSKAKALPGVRVVLTGKDVEKYPPVSAPMRVIETKARQVGDTIAAVVADSPEIAEEAVSLLSVTYKVLTPVFDLDAALKVADDPINGQKLTTGELVVGDIDKGFKDAEVVMDLVTNYEQRPVYPIFPERTSCVAEWRDNNTRLTVWPTAQHSSGWQTVLSGFFNIPQRSIRAIIDVVGSGYGNRITGICIARMVCLTALLAQEAGLPVRLTLSLQEDMVLTNARSAVYYDKFKLGCKKDGTITAVEIHSKSDGGSYGQAVYNASLNFDWRPSLRWPNVKYTYDGRYTNTTSTGTMRGVGNTPSHLAVLIAGDRMAHELGMNPLDFWLKNALKDFDILGSIKIPVSSCSLTECLEKAAAYTNYRSKWHKPGEKTLPNGRKHGIAIVPYTHACGQPGTGEHNATVKILRDGSIQGFIGVQDQGQATREAMSIILAEEFKISSLAKCQVTIGDTDSGAYGPASAGSVVTHTGGVAVLWAAEDAKKKLFELAAPILKVNASDLATKEHEVYVAANPANKKTIAEVMSGAGRRQIIGVGHPKWRETTRAIEFGSKVCELEVDTDTGLVVVKELTVFIDCGRVINKLSVELQFNSALTQGYEYGLYGGPVYDKETGYCLNANLLDYKWPGSTEVPYPAYVEAVEPVDRIGPHGAKGIGESAVNDIGPLILNAIFNATGVRITHNCIEVDTILKALGKV